MSLPAVPASSVPGARPITTCSVQELREPTLDPENRTLVQVRMTNAADADDIFRTLMGDKVEPRPEFIEKHALEVETLDVWTLFRPKVKRLFPCVNRR